MYFLGYRRYNESDFSDFPTVDAVVANGVTARAPFSHRFAKSYQNSKGDIHSHYMSDQQAVTQPNDMSHTKYGFNLPTSGRLRTAGDQVCTSNYFINYY